MKGFAVRYQAPDSPHACFQGCRGVLTGIVASETSPACIHVWTTIDDAFDWLLLRHPDLSEPLGMGTHYAAVVPIDTDELTPRPDWLRGTLFEFATDADHAESRPAFAQMPLF